jgi:hypothetical protein
MESDPWFGGGRDIAGGAGEGKKHIKKCACLYLPPAIGKGRDVIAKYN